MEVKVKSISPLAQAQANQDITAVARFLELVQGRFGPEIMNILIDSEETAEYLAKKFGVPDQLIRDTNERKRLVQMAQQYAQAQGQMQPDGVMDGQQGQINKVIGSDGISRSKVENDLINMNIASLFSSETGQEVLKYLRSITIELVNGANVSDAELRHLEGQRFLVGLIEQRIQQGHRAKNEQ